MILIYWQLVSSSAHEREIGREKGGWKQGRIEGKGGKHHMTSALCGCVCVCVSSRSCVSSCVFAQRAAMTVGTHWTTNEKTRASFITLFFFFADI